MAAEAAAVAPTRVVRLRLAVISGIVPGELWVVVHDDDGLVVVGSGGLFSPSSDASSPYATTISTGRTVSDFPQRIIL